MRRTSSRHAAPSRLTSSLLSTRYASESRSYCDTHVLGLERRYAHSAASRASSAALKNRANSRRSSESDTPGPPYCLTSGCARANASAAAMGPASAALVAEWRPLRHAISLSCAVAFPPRTTKRPVTGRTAEPSSLSRAPRNPTRTPNVSPSAPPAPRVRTSKQHVPVEKSARGAAGSARAAPSFSNGSSRASQPVISSSAPHAWSLCTETMRRHSAETAAAAAAPPSAPRRSAEVRTRSPANASISAHHAPSSGRTAARSATRERRADQSACAPSSSTPRRPHMNDPQYT